MQRGKSFYFRVYQAVRKIPKGKVATYGQVAAMCSAPRSARMVGWALNVLKPGTNVPWQRVLNHEGRITIENMRATKDIQAQLLRSEGVDVVLKEGNYWVDLDRFLWKPERDATEKDRL